MAIVDRCVKPEWEARHLDGRVIVQATEQFTPDAEETWITPPTERLSVTTGSGGLSGCRVTATLLAMPYEPIVPEGQHLGTSRNVDGAVTGHLFEDGTNDLKGHAAWQWVDEPDAADHSSKDHERPRQLTPEEQEMLEKLAAMIAVGVIAGAQAAAPHLKRWWSEKVVPGVIATWKRIARRRDRGNRDGHDRQVSSANRATFVASTTGIEVTLAETEMSMTRAEWSDRYRAMLLAGAFKNEQMRILANARIDDGQGDEIEGQNATQQLTPQQFVESIKHVLEANPSALDDETVGELIRVFAPRPDQERKALE